MGGTSHRSTLKKDHKRFKLRHSSKGLLKNEHKGKVEKAVAGKSGANRVLSKLDRRNMAKQLKQNKIADTKQVRRMYDSVEKNVCVIALTDDLDPVAIAQALSGNEEASFAYPSVTTVKNARYKLTIRWIIPDHTLMLAILDAARIADFVVFGMSASQEVNPEFGEQILRGVIGQGIALAVGVLPNLASAYPKRNLQLDVRKSLQSFFNHFFPVEEKLFALEIELELLNCQRVFCQSIPQQVNWRDNHRGWLVADQVGFDGEHVVVEGSVRGNGFHANRLVHLPGLGDFQVEKIEIKEETFVADDQQDGLDQLNPEEIELEDMEGYEDFYGDNEKYTLLGEPGLVRKFKMPKGTSEYQAKWLIDDVLEDVSDAEEDGEEFNGFDDDMEADDIDIDDTATVAPTEATEMHIELSAEEEERQLAEFRRLEREDAEFPDELELHPLELGKERLLVYRGVKSLAGCDWDYDEFDVEAPQEWLRLLRVGNYKATANKVHKQAEANAQCKMGVKARIYIKAPAAALEGINPQLEPFVVFGLMPHESKYGVCNWQFNRWEDYEEPIPLETSMVVQYGPRRVVINPLFSGQQHHKNNVQKFEAFAHDLAVATAIAPVTFSQCPTLFFRPKDLGLGLEFMGQGTFLNCDHTRIIAQRAVLTGHPVKIHKRMVTVRYMFFNTDDIEHFKSIPLFTKLGRTGFIKESLGTHGYYKATFDGKLTSQDIIGMSLYKRVWPRIAQEFSSH